jgi:FkbM family methyltransferase
MADIMDQSPLSRSFKDLTGMAVPVKVVDIGANMIDSEPPYAPLLRAGVAEVVGFEPNPEALERLNQLKGPHETYLPHPVGDGKTHTLRFCQAQGMTSLLQPNPKVLNLFHGFPEWGRVIAEEEMTTVRLDDMPETANTDLLKMDIQGGELMVLQNAEDRLKDVLVIQSEVEFLQMYVDQPLFSDMDIFLRERGFVFHRFFPTVSRVIRPLLVDNNIYAGLSQLLWADAIFVRDFTRPELLTDRQLLAMAEILHDCYQSIDLALHLLNEYDGRTGNQLGTTYLTSLTNPT